MASLSSAGKQLSPPAFGYQQATQSSARKHILIAEEREDRERGRENLRVDSRAGDRGVSTERAKSRATSRARSRDPPRMQQEQARSRDPKEKDKHQGGNALTRLIGRSDGTEKGKKKEKERDGQRRPPPLLRRTLDALHSTSSGVLGPVFVQAFVLTFIGEWGDRSQIATIALAAAHVRSQPIPFRSDL